MVVLVNAEGESATGILEEASFRMSWRRRYIIVCRLRSVCNVSLDIAS